MATVKELAKIVKQPWGGYINPSLMKCIKIDDGLSLNPDENIYGGTVGTVVDYMTRFLLEGEKEKAFEISLKGATMADKTDVASTFLDSIKGLDDRSIISACKLVTFDVYYRNPIEARRVKKGYKETNPDKMTLENIQIMLNRCMTFVNKYGPITKYGFTFESPSIRNRLERDMALRKEGVCGGYTIIASEGDGDFLTEDTMWDFKVSRNKPTSKQTMQLLIYWVMGQHSGQDVFKNISKIGIFNPRSGLIYTHKISLLDPNVINWIENELICY